jgi:hypothetical protein
LRRRGSGVKSVSYYEIPPHIVQIDWQPAGEQAQLESPGGASVELFRFEFKTERVDVTEGKSKAHHHPHKKDGAHRIDGAPDPYGRRA